MPHASRLTAHASLPTLHARLRPNASGASHGFGHQKVGSLFRSNALLRAARLLLPGISNRSPGWSTTGVTGV